MVKEDSATNENEKIEYRIRPVTRYMVCRFESADHVYGDGRVSHSGGSEPLGEFDNEMQAYKVALALCKDEHRSLGWPPGDGRITYPDHPDAMQKKVEPSQRVFP